MRNNIPDYIRDMQTERLINWTNNRLNEYNNRIDRLLLLKDSKIEKLNAEIEDEEIKEERRITSAENYLEEQLAIATSKEARARARAEFRSSKLLYKKIKRREQKKLQRRINIINRRWEKERLLGDTKSDRQFMYLVKTWAEKYRRKTVTIKYFGDDGKLIQRIQQPVWDTINLNSQYPANDLKIYEPESWERCIPTYRVVCQDPPPSIPPGSLEYENYVRCSVIQNDKEDWDCR